MAGDVVDFTKMLDKELGSSFDQETLLFAGFEDGGVFNYDTEEIRDIDDMLKVDGKARTLEQVLTLPHRQVPITFRRGPARRKVHSFVDEFFNESANNGGMSTSIRLVAAQMTGAFIYRKAYFEKCFTERDGKIVYDKVAWRPQSTCATVYDKRTGAFNGFKQMPIRWDDTEEVWIEPQRAFVYVHGTYKNPLEGVTDMQIPLWCFITKQKIRFLWYQFLEGQSLPKLHVTGPSRTEARKAAAEIVKLRSGGVVGTDKNIETEVIESSGRGATQFKEALQWLDAEASGSVLAGFTDLGAAAAQGTGSFALSKDQTDFFLMSQQAKDREMADCTNQYLLPDIVRANFGPKEKIPIMEFGPIREDDAAAAIGLLQATSQSPNQVLPREFMDELIERVAGFLELNTQRVREGLERAAAEATVAAESNPATAGNPFAPKVAGVAGAVGAATNAVVRKNERVLEDAIKNGG